MYGKKCIVNTLLYVSIIQFLLILRASCVMRVDAEIVETICRRRLPLLFSKVLASLLVCEESKSGGQR